MRLLYDNLVDAGATVITSSSEGTDLPDDNVQHDLRTKVWRTGTSTALEWVKFDFGSAQNVQAFAAINHDLTGSDTLIKIQANATDSWGGPSVDQAITWNADDLAYYFGSAQSYRWWRFTFTKSASGETRDVGRIFIGPYYETTKKITHEGLDIVPIDLSDTRRAIGGQTYSDERSIYHQVKVSFDLISNTQMAQFKTIAEAVGTHTPLFIDIDRTNMAYAWFYYVKYASFSARKVKLHPSNSPLWSTKMTFNEEL